MKLKYITFTFENCERITIDGKYVGDFMVDDIRKYISRVACNAICETNQANIFAIEIHKDANVERRPYGLNETHMTFDRLTLCDITHIEFELEENYVEKDKSPCVVHYCYSINWDSNDEYYNNYQDNYISENGHLYIVVAESKDIEDFFDLEEIDDKDCMNFKFEMYSVGDNNNREVITNEMIDEIYDNIMGDN